MHDFRKSLVNSALHKVLKRLHYPLEVMLICVRWYVAYPLSLRHVEEMMQERGVFVDHTTVHRWAIKMLPVLAAVFRRRKRSVGSSWRMDETYIKVCGQWKYLYRAVDRAGDTVDFLLTAKRDMAAARRFLERAINPHDVPEKITIDKSGANTAAIESAKAAGKKFGCDMREMYWTLGSYDLVAVIDAKDEASYLAFGAALAGAGNVRTQSLRAFTKDEMNAVFAKLG